MSIKNVLDMEAVRIFNLGVDSTEIFVNVPSKILMVTFLLEPVRLDIAIGKMRKLLCSLRAEYDRFPNWTVRFAGDNKGGFTIVTATFEFDKMIKFGCDDNVPLVTIASQWSVGVLK